MFIVRTRGDRPDDPRVRVAARRATPDSVPNGAGQTDLFCVGDEAALERLEQQGWAVVRLRDGWYQGDGEGGVAIWGQGEFWEVRDTPFTVREAAGPSVDPGAGAGGGDQNLDVRRGIFGV